MRITVRAGDSLWRYSQLFRLPPPLLIDSNPGVDPARLAPGQTLEVPGYVTAQERVRAGDTLWTIAAGRGMPVEALLLVNPGIQPARLTIGQPINVPLRVDWMIVSGQRSYTYEALMAEIRQLSAVYPFLRNRSIGESVLGRAIPEIRIGRGAKRLHVNASFHANEWITTPVLMRFLNEYALALTNRTTIRGLGMMPYYESATLSMVPMVNPDGVNLVLEGPPQQEPHRSSVIRINGGSADFSGWKANINGVDLNNQYPAEWEREAARGPQRPSPRDYSGSAPLTEPEAIAMAGLTRESDYARVLAFHTQGQVIYWGFMGLEPPGSEALANTFGRVSGYTPIRTVESYAGYKDWFIQDWRRPGFTIELGLGTNPLPLSQFEEIYQESLGILLANLIY